MGENCGHELLCRMGDGDRLPLPPFELDAKKLDPRAENWTWATCACSTVYSTHLNSRVQVVTYSITCLIGMPKFDL